MLVMVFEVSVVFFEARLVEVAVEVVLLCVARLAGMTAFVEVLGNV